MVESKNCRLNLIAQKRMNTIFKHNKKGIERPINETNGTFTGETK